MNNEPPSKKKKQHIPMHKTWSIWFITFRCLGLSSTIPTKHTARIAYFKFCLNCLNIEEDTAYHKKAETHFLCPIQVTIFLGLYNKSTKQISYIIESFIWKFILNKFPYKRRNCYQLYETIVNTVYEYFPLSIIVLYS